MTDVFINSFGAFLPGAPVPNSQMEDYLGHIGGKKSRHRAIVLRQNKIKTRHYAVCIHHQSNTPPMKLPKPPRRQTAIRLWFKTMDHIRLPRQRLPHQSRRDAQHTATQRHIPHRDTILLPLAIRFIWRVPRRHKHRHIVTTFHQFTRQRKRPTVHCFLGMKPKWANHCNFHKVFASCDS